ncbi:hypothetical protein GIB67_007960 [Kingdonia uniflora]|uniref:type II protein arginine methyltransferase n=1 Tax=Kingdonia uniflora TaxID=39325 RepID=A0A7J7LTE7_9MAGN|nr:hypothetical protein GIB67_007960 [Kingdonia uniflora]
MFKLSQVQASRAATFKFFCQIAIEMTSRLISIKKLSLLFSSNLQNPKLLSRKPFETPAVSAFFSTGFVGEKPILVRDFIRSALYDPSNGYFSKTSGPVGLLERSIKFNKLEGRRAYMQYLDSIYKQNDIAWFTPVELFKPWYAHGIAEAIMRTANFSVPLKIFEIGGGAGTCAKCIMDYILLNAPGRVYQNMTYTSVEISSSLAKKQMETVGKVRSHLSRFKVECRDAADKSGWGDVDSQPCWVIMLEHDPWWRWRTQAKSVILEVTKLLYMMSGMPMPLGARVVEAQMFAERPQKPDLEVKCQWLDTKDPDFHTARKLMMRARSMLLKLHLCLSVNWKKEEKLLKAQADIIKTNKKQYELFDNLMYEGMHGRLARRYNVLDNLPHDLIYSENQVSAWMEVWLEKRQDSLNISEMYKPIQDPFISRCVEIINMEKGHATLASRVTSLAKSIWSKVFPKAQRSWVPTGCLKLLEVLHGALPKMSLIASDFSYLPDVRIPGDRAPLVSSKKDGKNTDHNSYLDAKGDADIFFPTDFWLLELIDHYASGWLNLQKDDLPKQGKKRRTVTLDTAQFMGEFGLPSKTRTKDGYNPLLDDFRNTKFYISVPTHNTK